MSFMIVDTQLDRGVAVVRTRASSDLAGLHDVTALWKRLQEDPSVAAVAVVGEREQFSSSEPSESGREVPWPIGPKGVGLMKPFGVGLRGEVFDFGLQLVGDADVVVAAADVVLADTSAQRGVMVEHALSLQGYAPQNELARLALLGARGVMSADRALALGVIDALVDPDSVEATVIERLRALCAP